MKSPRKSAPRRGDAGDKTPRTPRSFRGDAPRFDNRDNNRNEGRPPFSGSRPDGDRPARSFERREGGFNRDNNRDNNRSEGRPPFRGSRPDGDRPARSFERREGGFNRDNNRSEGRPPFRGSRPDGDRPARSFERREGGFNRDNNRDNNRSEGRPPFRGSRPDGDRPARSFERREGGFNRDNNRSEGRPPFRGSRPEGDRPARSFERREGGFNRDNNRSEGRPDFRGSRPDGDRPARSFERREGGFNRDNNRSEGRPDFRGSRPDGDRPARSFERREGSERRGGGFSTDRPSRGPRTRNPRAQEEAFNNQPALTPPDYNEAKFAELEKNHGGAATSSHPDTIRLNKYLAHAGVAARREADQLIAAGYVTVNGEVVTEMGYQVRGTDVLSYRGKTLSPEKKRYILLNKPKDYITTVEDPEGRKTVLDLVGKACKERLFPVGRLDRNTTGLLLLTNDGELADKLSHPSNEVRKIYQVDLDRPLEREDFDKIAAGITLEDGLVPVDGLEYVDQTRVSIGIEIHSGKNRVVRRLFESLGYNVEKLDRVVYANLTKKDLPRGHYRFLAEQEVINLKFFV